jgi:hypothetical protein
VLPTSPGDFTGGSSQHPLDDITAGEKLIKTVYETIRNSPHWNESLLVITYDEHGGFFDHVVPPTTVSPGDKITDEENNHHNFDFTQLGVRVPTIVISPLIPRGTIDHAIYDHASLLATLEKLYGLKPMTRRDRQANTFNHLFALESPRADAPSMLPEPADSHCESDQPAGQLAPGTFPSDQDNVAIDPSLRGFLHFSFMKDYKLAPAPARKALIRKFLKINEKGDALKYMQEVGARTRKRRKSTSRKTHRRSRAADDKCH